MDKQLARSAILQRAATLAAFDGWNDRMLLQAATEAGYQKLDLIRAFPGGAAEAAEAFLKSANDAMLAALQHYHLDSMKIRERIALAVRLHISAYAQHPEALRKALALFALPFYAPRSLRHLYSVVDDIWHAVGDRSTDFNFYTKRFLLAGVYSSTLLYWLNDRSENHAESWAFLDRRIENVMQVEKAKFRLRQWIG